ncbi:hypothetical protein LPB140_11085 [Sphingorhabdus lutea]|uniref:Gene transfer agent family protein n=1 Tax=Sphingorhabdus lutea TaxID=1913578 RepID=A0A1L3JDR3_9SPHN|nr:gene transfer agent family protein [Sphingorhabdus lutea]APG63239.1 hypothetical protein LPB140_11085 [Sphingorhabdus lutea]
MNNIANPHRGEAALNLDGEIYILRPSFENLIAAEEEIGPLFEMVEQAAAGQLKLSHLSALYWHCLCDKPVDRKIFSAKLVAGGLANATPPLKILLQQILMGR